MTNGFLGFDHLDVRVPSLAAVEAFYDLLMPALGLTEKTFSFVDAAGDWHDATPEGAYNTVEFSERPRPEDRGRFIGFIEDRDMRVVRTRIAFLVATRDDVLAFERRLHEFGAREIEREANFAAYPAVFFSDPGGTRLEIIARRGG
jgi:catechol 2,3-dioxygenase-like lactoylglutathione lyase family enzyme